MSRKTNPVRLIMAKELKDGLRDKRSLISALSLPLIGPLVLMVVFISMNKTAAAPDALVLPVVNQEAAPQLIEYLRSQDVEILTADENFRQGIKDRTWPCVLVIPKDFEQNLAEVHISNLDLYVDRSNHGDIKSARKIQSLIQSFGQQVGMLRLLARGVHPEVTTPYLVQEVDLSTDQEKAVVFLNMIPLFVIMAAFVCGMQIAVDTTAGERERGSLEALLMNPIPTTSLVLGKWLTAVIFSAVGVVLTLAGSVTVLQFVDLGVMGLKINIGVPELLGLLAVILPLAFLATGIQTLVATFSRSFKEAQTNLSLLIFLPMVPSMASMLDLFQGEDWMTAIPLLGHQVLLTKVLEGGQPSALQFVMAGLSALVAGLAGVWATARLFKKEQIIFGR